MQSKTVIMNANGPVNFNEGAVRELKMLMNDEKFTPGNVLRIGVKGGGCSGLSYMLGFDEPKPEDNSFEANGLPYIVNPAHEMYLAGMTIEWHDGLDSRGFKFVNPNASSTCGCGTSFAV